MFTYFVVSLLLIDKKTKECLNRLEIGRKIVSVIIYTHTADLLISLFACKHKVLSILILI